MKKLRLLETLWLIGPIVAWCSYQPLFKLGQDGTSYYELSLPLIYLVVVALVGVPSVWRHRSVLLRQKSVWLTGAFVGYSVLSLWWTPTPVRGVLTVGIIGALWLAFLAGLAETKRLRACAPMIAKVAIVSAVVVSLLAFVQAWAGIWLSRAETLLCAGCVAEQFGFVRPNVFAIEPQFLGSLLLAPLLLLVWLKLTARHAYANVALFIIAAALFLTLSRGAIYAFLAAVLLLFVMYRTRPRAIATTCLLLLASFGTVLVFQGAAAALHPKLETTFAGAVSASISQLSLGVIDISAGETKEPPLSPPETEQPVPRRDGYVEESTDIRVDRSRLALEAWAAHPLRMIFGAGAGGSGVAMHQMYPGQIGAREITQNQYVEIVLEYGLVGLALWLGVLAGLCYGLRHRAWAWVIVLAYGLQWAFFSGYPNALHIYLTLVLLFIVLRAQPVPATRS